MKSTNRTGRVSKVNYEAGTYEVTYFDRGKSVTSEINAVSNGEYKMPSVGQMVSVSHNSNGAEGGVAVGTIWCASNKPAEGYEGLYRKEYANTQGLAYERYDANTGVYTQHTNGGTGRDCGGTIQDTAGGAAYFTASGLVMLQSKAAGLSIKAAQGVGVIAGTTISVQAGGLIGVNAGADLTMDVAGTLTITAGGATVTISGGSVTVDAATINVTGGSGDITIEGISLKNHKHTDSTGGDTEGAKA